MINHSQITNLALQICSEKFLSIFNKEFLNSITIFPWKRDYGPKDSLFLIQRDTYFAVMVDADLSYTRQNILAWTRVLAEGGLLILEAIPNRESWQIAQCCNFILEPIEEPDPNIWVFRKKKALSVEEILYNLIEAHHNNASDNEILEIIDKLEQREPIAPIVYSLIARLNIYKKYNLTQLALNDCLKYSDIYPIPDNHMLSAISKICYSDKLYYQGFKERSEIFDRWYPVRTSEAPAPHLANKRWRGEEIKDKTLVIWSEFGLGDEIMFSQLAYYFKLQGVKKVILVSAAAIVQLLRSSLDIDEVISITEVNHKLTDFDYWVYPYDILAYIKKPLSQLRKRSPYLFADKTLIEKYRHIFPHTGKLKIGIVWKGSSGHENDIARSIHNLRHIETLFNIANIDWYCIQKECNENELRLLEKYHIPHITKDFTDFSQTAAAMSHLDYFISVDTSAAHCAGALGLPTFLLLPYIVDWRWGLNETSSVWYPNMEILRWRANHIDEWEEVINELKLKLIKLTQL